MTSTGHQATAARARRSSFMRNTVDFICCRRPATPFGREHRMRGRSGKDTPVGTLRHRAPRKAPPSAARTFKAPESELPAHTHGLSLISSPLARYRATCPPSRPHNPLTPRVSRLSPPATMQSLSYLSRSGVLPRVVVPSRFDGRRHFDHGSSLVRRRRAAVAR